MKKRAMCAVVSLVAVSLVLSVSCSKSGGDPMDAMIEHTKAMVQIIKDNKADCTKCVQELNAYADKHKKEFAEIVKKGQEMEKSMSDEEKKKYSEKMMKKMGDIMKDSMAVMMEIQKACPDQAAKIAEAMRSIK